MLELIAYADTLSYQLFATETKYRVVCAYAEARANRNARATKLIRFLIFSSLVKTSVLNSLYLVSIAKTWSDVSYDHFLRKGLKSVEIRKVGRRLSG